MMRNFGKKLFCAVLAAVLTMTVALAAQAEPEKTPQEVRQEAENRVPDSAKLESYLDSLTGEQLQTLLDDYRRVLKEAPSKPEGPESGSCGKKLTWSLGTDGVLTISGSGAMQDYTPTEPAPWFGRRTAIRKVVMELGTEHIGSFAFYGCTSLTELRLPGSVKSAGTAALFGCTGLEKLVLPTELEKLGACVLADCTRLKSISFPAGLKHIPFGTFYHCTALPSVTFPQELEEIGAFAFAECTTMGKLHLPKSLTSLGSYAYANCRSLANVTIPEQITTLPAGLFAGCTRLENASMPDGVSAIGAYAFDGCESLGKFPAPAALTAVGDGAFRGCISLTKAVLPQEVTELGAQAFSGCTGLAQITLNDALTLLGDRCFYGCKKLQSVTIPAAVTAIGAEALSGTALQTLEFSGDAPTAGEHAFPEGKIQAVRGCTGENWADDGDWTEGFTWQVQHPSDSEITLEATEAGCTQPGHTAGKQCAACGQTLSGCEEIPALGHIWEDGICITCGTQENEETMPAEETPETEETEALPETEADEEAAQQSEPAETADAEETETEENAESAQEQPASEETAEPAEEIAGAVITLSDVSSGSGTETVVEVSLENNPGFVSMTLAITYDETALELIGAEDTDLIPGGEHGTAYASGYRLVWANDTAKENIRENGIVARLTFRVLADAPEGVYRVEAALDADSGDVYDCDLAPVEFTVRGGSIIVSTTIPGDVNGDGRVDNRDRAMLARYLAGWPGYADIRLEAADVNGDGRVNNLDRAILTRYLAGWDGYQLPMVRTEEPAEQPAAEAEQETAQESEAEPAV